MKSERVRLSGSFICLFSRTFNEPCPEASGVSIWVRMMLLATCCSFPRPFRYLFIYLFILKFFFSPSLSWDPLCAGFWGKPCYQGCKGKQFFVLIWTDFPSVYSPWLYFLACSFWLYFHCILFAASRKPVRAVWQEALFLLCRKAGTQRGWSLFWVIVRRKLLSPGLNSATFHCAGLPVTLIWERPYKGIAIDSVIHVRVLQLHGL